MRFPSTACIPVLLGILLICTGCGPGRGDAALRSRRVVLPDGSAVALTAMDITTPAGDPAIDNAITQARQADAAYWQAVAASNDWTALHLEIRQGLTRDRYAERIRRQHLEEWYRTEITERDKAEASERQLALFDAVSAQVMAGTAEARRRELWSAAAERSGPALAAYEALGAAVGPDDALLRTVATYNRGILTGLSGRIPAGKALMDEAHGYAVRKAPVAIIRQCLRGHEELRALEKQMIMFELDERQRRR